VNCWVPPAAAVAVDGDTATDGGPNPCVRTSVALPPSVAVLAMAEISIR
jgi:hypothetical protein